MSRNGKVIVAMSGGVDSSVAAALLKEQGYECVGIFMRVGAAMPEEGAEEREQGIEGSRDREEGAREARRHDGTERVVTPPPRRLKHGCCSATDALDARAVAGRLGIPFYALNFEKHFDGIIDYFVDEYAAGRTPNPCVMCNIHLKFGKLLRYADLMDAEFVATGHYARILRRDGRSLLARSRNAAKDQSYVLYGIRRADLPRCLFPLGEIEDKARVRRIAADLGLRVHDKPDSQEICFVPNNDYRQLVHARRPETKRTGEVRDTEGHLLGSHDGVASFTIGQRRGLGIAAGKPIYVTHLDVLSNRVTVGPRERLLSGGLIADNINWLSDPPRESVPVEIKIRHMHTAAPGTLRAHWGEQGSALPTEVEATFEQPQPAVTPGQAAVFYADGTVLGGGWIREAAENSE
ncbi:MAG: tRNA 2-thiouridine(34) synthase MnmA [Planctomycetes bacterium]|nr:tRNA 2-thiouridine(34) synthase MnmA [Planctomycetota bacterium]